jgi:hypothetical protein
LERNFIVLRLHNLYADDSDDEDDDCDDIIGEGDRLIERDLKDEKDGKNGKGGKVLKIGDKEVKRGAKDVIEVEVDLSMSAYANVSRMYGHKKVAQAKEVKTLEQSQRALKVVEEQSTRTLEAQNIKRNLQAVRKVHWFEKFNWFVTSEGYLVLSGRDAQQNEALVKRYLRPGDVYVHAELHGASSCIVRGKAVPSTMGTDGKIGFKPISPFALQEAGNMTVCRSGAWGNKIVTSAWWVFGSQVSKTAPTGEYVSTGSFMIYGKKHFLPPMPLEMGFGVMFRLEDGSVTRHAGERKDKSTMCDETESVLSEAASRYGIEFEGLGLREVDTDDEGSKGSDGGEEEEEQEESEEIKAISIGAFQLDSIPESEGDNEEDRERDVEKERERDDMRERDREKERERKAEKGKDSQGKGEGKAEFKGGEKGGENKGTGESKREGQSKKTEKNQEEGGGRLTAKERRLLKKKKTTGEDTEISRTKGVDALTQESKNNDDEVDGSEEEEEEEIDYCAKSGAGKGNNGGQSNTKSG